MNTLFRIDQTSSKSASITAVALALMLGLTPILTGCDSSNPVGDNEAESQTVNGRVTNNQSYGKAPRAVRASKQGTPQAANVEGAAVTAASVDAQGRTNSLDVNGQAETNAQGRYSINVDDASEYVIVKAKKGSEFSSRVLVNSRNEAGGAVNAMPMTVESKSEARVYTRVESGDADYEEFSTAADVAAYVNSKAASRIEREGASEASNAAAAIRSAARAEAQFFAESDNEDVHEDELQENKDEAFLQLQADLAASSDSKAELSALNAFFSTMGETYAEAGASAEGQAQARQSGAAAVRVEFTGSSDTELGLRQGAELLAAHATESAIEAAFDGGADIGQAAADLRADIRAASSTQALAEAKSDFRSTVKSKLESKLGINATALTAAEAAIEADAMSELLGSLTSGSLGSAYARFFADAEAQAQSSLTASNVNKAEATTAANVLVLLEGMSSTDGNR